MEEQDYKNQEVLNIIKLFMDENGLDFNYCELYEKLEGYLL